MVAELTGEQGSEWAAIVRVADVLGVGTAETVRKWVRRPSWVMGRGRGD